MNRKCPECGENCLNCVGLNLDWFEQTEDDKEANKESEEEDGQNMCEL
jgi:hypothetical protein